jgi:F-type H+-transporting ATPase subunit delta
MKFSEIASRYSKALFDLSKEKEQQDKVFSEIRAIADLLNKHGELKDFLVSPLIRVEDKETALKAALEKAGLSEESMNFLLLLARKDRFDIFDEIVESYQFQTDESHGVTRGQVRSAAVLSPSEREDVEKTVSKITGKRVILSYKEDPGLIGGVVAQVGSFTFDDSLSSHLTRLKEEINRRTH